MVYAFTNSAADVASVVAVVFVNVLARSNVNFEFDSVDHCSNAAGNGCERNSLRRGGVNNVYIICTIVGVLGKGICGAVYSNLCGVCLVFCYVNNNFGYFLRNGEGEGCCCGAGTQLNAGVTLCVVSRAVNLAQTGKVERVSTGGVRLGGTESISVNVSCVAVCTEIKYDGFGGLVSFAAVLAGAVVISVTGSGDGFGDAVQFANGTYLLNGTVGSTSCIGGGEYFVSVFASNNFVNPTILHLRSTAVLTDNTPNGDFITEVRLVSQGIITGLTVVGVETVDVELIAVFILDVNVTILSIYYFNNNTGYIVLIGRVTVCCVYKTELVSV